MKRLVLKLEYFNFSGFRGGVQGHGRASVEPRLYRGIGRNGNDLESGGVRWSRWEWIGIVDCLDLLRGSLLHPCEIDLSGRVPGAYGNPTSKETDDPPWDELGCDEQTGSNYREIQEYCAAECLVREIGGRSDKGDHEIVPGCKVGHAVLQVTHVAKEVLGSLRSRADGRRWSQGRACIFIIGDCRRGRRCRGRCRMPADESGYHDEEQTYGQREHEEEVRIQTDEGEGGQKGQGMCCLAPAEEPNHLFLENEDDPNTCVEAAEVVRHDRQGEGRSRDMYRRLRVSHGLVAIFNILGGNEPFEEFGKESVLE